VVLSGDEVREIRKKSKAGETMRFIAKHMRVSTAQVHRIIQRKSRSDVK